MSRSQLLLMLLVSHPFCAVAELAGAQQASAAELAGRYYRGDGTGYNVTIVLDESGGYRATWIGCLGEYGTAKGSWSVSGSLVALSPDFESGMMKGHLQVLHIVAKDDVQVLVPDLDDDYYKKYGADKYSAFHRQAEFSGE